MDWVVNQIWLGSNPPIDQLNATKEKAIALGCSYRLWEWDELTARFGSFYFGNLDIERIPDQGLTFLTKFYMWFILEMYRGRGMYLDATRELPFSTLDPHVDFALAGVYTTKDYEPWFLVSTSISAISLAKFHLIRDLEIRRKVNGQWMFHFFSTALRNIIGTRFFQNTLMPVWKSEGIRIFNSPNPETTTPQLPEPEFRPSKEENTPPQSEKESISIHELQERTRKLKIKPIFALTPQDCKRVVIVGDTVMGITNVETLVQADDLLVYTDKCPFLHLTQAYKDISHAIYYTSSSTLPSYVRDNKDQYFDVQQVIPNAAFNGYYWKENIKSTISLPVALALSYKELNPSLPVILHGHTTADDIMGNFDSGLEEVLMRQKNIVVTPPCYDLLVLVLSREGNALHRVKLGNEFEKEIEYTKYTYRICFSTPKEKYYGVTEKTWPLRHAGDDDKDDEIGKKMYVALKNARNMRFKYLFLMLDDTQVNIRNLGKWTEGNTPQTFGKRVYVEEEDILAYDLSYGFGFSWDALTTIMKTLSPEIIEATCARPDILLAHVIQERHLGMVDISDLCDTDRNGWISCVH